MLLKCTKTDNYEGKASIKMPCLLCLSNVHPHISTGAARASESGTTRYTAPLPGQLFDAIRNQLS